MVRVRYSYVNEGPRPIHFLWNIHPALAVSTTTRLDVPARHGLVEAWMNEQFAAGLEYEWPYAPDRSGRNIDLSAVPSPAEAVADHQRRILAVIRGVQYEAASRLDRTAEMHRAGALEIAGLQLQVGEQLVHRQ
jgi:hypothetical protein